MRVLALAVLVAALVLVSADNSEHDVEYIAAAELTSSGFGHFREVRGGKGRGEMVCVRKRERLNDQQQSVTLMIHRLRAGFEKF